MRTDCRSVRTGVVRIWADRAQNHPKYLTVEVTTQSAREI